MAHFSFVDTQRWVRRLLPVVSCTLMFVAACTLPPDPFNSPLPPTPTLVAGEALAFTLLADGVSDRCPSRDTTFARLATTPAEYAQLLTQLPIDASRLPSSAQSDAIDFGRQAVVGVVSDCGYCQHGARVTGVQSHGGVLHAYAEWLLLQPEAGCPTPYYSSYQLVAIEWDSTLSTHEDVKLVLYPVYANYGEVP